MAKRHKKLTRAQKRALNRKLFRAARSKRRSSKRPAARRGRSSKRRSSRRAPKAKRYSKRSYTRFGRRKSKRSHASSLKHRPSMAALMAMNRELGIHMNPRRRSKRRGRGRH